MVPLCSLFIPAVPLPSFSLTLVLADEKVPKRNAGIDWKVRVHGGYSMEIATASSSEALCMWSPAVISLLLLFSFCSSPGFNGVVEIGAMTSDDVHFLGMLR
ncbi:unnamed protein product [Lactuca virosa]|uniref:Secreted protein n=1 Tax=Lactuca virosa TaxID=75947 RepID=A0AAU9NCT8_9ASTR|nr:unnamed protein product [Lactuca virosa]